MPNIFTDGQSAARQFRREFLGRKARSNKTGEEGIVCGGYIATGTDIYGVRGDFELQTAVGVERMLRLADLVFLDIDGDGNRITALPAERKAIEGPK